MKQEEINYEDLIELGFKRFEMNDPLFEKQYGYPCFFLEKRVMKQLYFTWNCTDRTVWIIRGGKKNIKAQLPIDSLSQLHKLLNFFETEDTKFSKKEEEQNNYSPYNIA